MTDGAKDKQPDRITDPRTQLVDPVFDALANRGLRDDSLPDVVARNREQRARQRLTEALISRGDHAVPASLRESVRSLAEKWAKVGFADSFPEVEAFEIRCAEERASEQGEDAQERRFRQTVIERHGTIEIRGLQMSERIHQSLDVAYVPLHLEDPSRVEVEKIQGAIEIRRVPRLPAVDLVRRHKRVLIV